MICSIQYTLVFTEGCIYSGLCPSTASEYGIRVVMDTGFATQCLQDGEIIGEDGTSGWIVLN